MKSAFTCISEFSCPLRNIVMVIAFLYGPHILHAQEKPAIDDYYKSTNLKVGYSYSFGEPNDTDYHLVDLGINTMRYGGRHGGGYEYGVGTEIGLNTDRFIIGSKISGVIYYQFIVFGSELITYTDFENWTLRLVPMIGIGGEKFRLTINPHVILTNKNFQPINRGVVNLSVNLSLDRRKV